MEMKEKLKKAYMPFLGGGAALIVASFLLPVGGKSAAATIGVILFDRTATLYPLTMQNAMIFIFCIGLAELFLRWKSSTGEIRQVESKYLPEDEDTVLLPKDVAKIRKKMVGDESGKGTMLYSLIDICALQFLASKSVDQALGVLNSQLELISHKIDLHYGLIRFIVWLIPTLGFIGTVLGIANALMGIDENNIKIGPVTESLGFAFNTTLIALIMSAILVYLLHLVQEKEEESLNEAGEYCLKNLINRMYVG